MRFCAPIPLAAVLGVAAVVFLGAIAPADAAAPASEPEFRARVRELQEAGTLGYEQALRVRFQRVFAPASLPASLRSESPWPTKSVTMLIHEYESIREGLDETVARGIDAYLGQDSEPAEAYETEHLRLAFHRSGPDAVPADDLDLNGVPDFVERIGTWGEVAWTSLVDQAGFMAPLRRNGRVEVSFREMSAYGYTQVVDDVPAILLHRSFGAFPENRDPEGSQFGAAKVTIAHELKHASQFASSAWTEDHGWLEADATWAEDFVFDETDDYLRYLPYGSPVSHPASWLPASYEDCLWQQCVEQAQGIETLVDFFERRSTHISESVWTSFGHALDMHGTSLDDALTTLGIWSYFSGANAPGRPVGFADADLFPTPPLRSHITQAGVTITDDLRAMSTHLVLALRDERTGRPTVSFVGDRSRAFALTAVVTRMTGELTVYRLPMVSPSSSAAELPVDWNDIGTIVVVVTNVSSAGDARYSLTLNDQGAVAVAEGIKEQQLSLEAARPNPFRSRTVIAFSLVSGGPVRLAVYDIGGRLIRSLHDGSVLPAGPHQTAWDGVDQAGRAAAPGVYYYRLESGPQSATQRVLLLR